MPYLTPDAPGSFSGRVLLIPNSYVASVNGALQELANYWNWEAFGSDSVDDAVARMEAMIEAYQMSEIQNVIQPYVTLSPGLIEAGHDPMEFLAATGQINGGVWRWSSPAILNSVAWLVAAPPDWLMDVRVIGQKRNSAGKFRLYIDNGSVGSEVDWYAGSITENVIADFTDAALDTFQLHLVQLQVTGKHASSSNYNLFLSEVLIRVHQ